MRFTSVEGPCDDVVAAVALSAFEDSLDSFEKRVTRVEGFIVEEIGDF